MRSIAALQWTIFSISLFMVLWAFLSPISSVTGLAALEPKYPIHWMPPPAKQCIVKEYPFKTIYGIEYQKWDGTTGCYVPRRSRHQPVAGANPPADPCAINPCAPGCLPQCVPAPPIHRGDE